MWVVDEDEDIVLYLYSSTRVSLITYNYTMMCAAIDSRMVKSVKCLAEALKWIPFQLKMFKMKVLQVYLFFAILETLKIYFLQS